MKRKEVVDNLREFLKVKENRDSDKIVAFLEQQGMKAESRYSSLFGSAVIYDWEENIDDNRRCRELDRQADRD